MALEAEMRKNFWLIILVVASLYIPAFAAEKTANFSGIWRLDPDRTKVDKTSPVIRQLNFEVSGGISNVPRTDETVDSPENPAQGLADEHVLHIVQTEAELQTTREYSDNDQRRTVIQKFKLDGSQCFNLASDGQSEFVSRSSWKNGKLIHAGSQTRTLGLRRTEIYVNEEYSLSKDGRTLTIKTMITAPQGVTKLKQVFIGQDR